jgi:hypothetical protein
MNARDILLVADLVEEAPPLLPLLQEHLDTYDSLLPHIFMADVTRWAVREHTSNPSDQSLALLLQRLETAFEAGDPHEHELIGASFLENLPSRTDPGADIRERLGPAMRRHLDQYS